MLSEQAAIKLKWDQSRSYMDEAMISTHPISLRDGSLITYCDEEVMPTPTPTPTYICTAHTTDAMADK